MTCNVLPNLEREKKGATDLQNSVQIKTCSRKRFNMVRNTLHSLWKMTQSARKNIISQTSLNGYQNSANENSGPVVLQEAQVT